MTFPIIFDKDEESDKETLKHMLEISKPKNKIKLFIFPENRNGQKIAGLLY